MLKNKTKVACEENSTAFQIALIDDCTMSTIGFESLLSCMPMTCNLHHANNLTALKSALIKEEIQIVVIEPFSADKALFQVIDFIHWVKHTLPEIKIVILTRIQDKTTLRSLYNIDIHALISKDERLGEISSLIAQVIENNNVCSPHISRLLNSKAKPMHPFLTEAELTVLNYFLRGVTQKKIADLTNRSAKTISCHKRNAMRKLGVKGNTGLVAFAKTASGNSLLNYQGSEMHVRDFERC